MKISIFYRLTCYMVSYLSLTSLLVFFGGEINLVSARSEIRTKLLLQNIRTHLAQKVDEVVQQKECESGLTFCKDTKTKEEDEKSEEIPPPPKILRGHHKPIIKVNPKDIIHTMMPKPKVLFRKVFKEEGHEKRKLFQPKEMEPESSEETVETEEEEKSEEVQIKKGKPDHEPPKSFSDTKKNIRKSEPPIIEEKKPDVKIKVEAPEPKIQKETKKIKSEVKIKVEVPEPKIQKETKKVKEERKVTDTGPVVKKFKKVDIKTESKNLKVKSKDIPKDGQEVLDKEKTEDSLLLEEIFLYVLDSDEVKNDLCKKQSQIYLKQLKKYKIWALMSKYKTITDRTLAITQRQKTGTTYLRSHTRQFTDQTNANIFS